MIYQMPAQSSVPQFNRVAHDVGDGTFDPVYTYVVSEIVSFGRTDNRQQVLLDAVVENHIGVQPLEGNDAS